MKRTWIPDGGWTGAWEVPDVLRRPISDAERAMLVQLVCGGAAPKRLVSLLEEATSIGELDVRRTVVDLGPQTRAIVPSDDEYPAELIETAAPPLVLFVRGQRLDALRPIVAIVGARACTSGASRFATKLSEAFAVAGFTVASGLARGIDGAAHRGALRAGATIAVLGSAFDVCYPAEHAPLLDDVVAAGAAVTEFPPGVGPRAWHFPARNRIIAGLSCALIVVEAGLRSGALITAGFALEDGRHVLAATTGPENPAGAGVRAMLRDGAQLVVDPEQAVEVVSGLISDQGFAFGEPVPRRPARTPPEHLLEVYEAVTEEATVEAIAAASGSDAGRTAAALAELELGGFVVSRDGRWSRET